MTEYPTHPLDDIRNTPEGNVFTDGVRLNLKPELAGLRGEWDIVNARESGEEDAARQESIDAMAAVTELLPPTDLQIASAAGRQTVFNRTARVEQERLKHDA